LALPFALTLGCDVGIVVEAIGGTSAGQAAAAGFTALALIGWYGIEYLRRLKTGGRERALMNLSRGEKLQKTPLTARLDQLLTEARVILPGAQAVLGFQLIIVVTSSFDALPPSSKLIHGISLGLVALAVILLMAPAAYHRIVFAGEDTQELYNVGSILVLGATLPLGLGLAGDLYVVIARIAQSPGPGIAAAVTAMLLFISLWYVYPFARRWLAGKKLRTFVR
jgi:hypothetical protein